MLFRSVSTVSSRSLFSKRLLFTAIKHCGAFAFRASISNNYHLARPFSAHQNRVDQRSRSIHCHIYTRPLAREFTKQIVGDMSTKNENESSNYNLAQDMSELFDIYPVPPSYSHYNSIIAPDWGDLYFPYPKPTGKSKERSKVHMDGDWHRSVQVWIVQAAEADNDGNNSSDVNVLLQRRSPYKDTHPNLLDVSCAGHVNAGDDVIQTTMRELEEELGGNGMINEIISLGDLERSRVFTVTSSIEGETERHGKFVCREYQDVFILWWKQDIPLEMKLFAPVVKEEVTGFEIINGKELIQKMREGNTELVPRSAEYIDALAKAIGCENQ